VFRINKYELDAAIQHSRWDTISYKDIDI